VQGAHQAGVTHRDLKPANILLANEVTDPDNPSLELGKLRERRLQLTPKVGEFGQAKKLDEKVRQTVTGEVLSMSGYMPPRRPPARCAGRGQPWTSTRWGPFCTSF